MELEIKQGDKFLCIKTVVMQESKTISYIEGVIYKSHFDGAITDEQGIRQHSWNGEPFKKHFTKITDQSFNIWN